MKSSILKCSILKCMALGVASLLIIGCGSKEAPAPMIDETQVYIQEPVRTAPGVVEYVWEEPMVDVVEIPPGLDPEGVYYRPAHQSIVEIRQGRWKHYKPKK